MPNQLKHIKSVLSNYEGCMVRLYAIGERNKIIDIFGILEGVYSDIFIVITDQDGYTRRYCYSYSEILTKRVKVIPALPVGQAIV